MKKIVLLFILVGVLFGAAVYTGIIKLTVDQDKVDEAKAKSGELITKGEEVGGKALEKAKEIGGKALEKGKDAINDATKPKPAENKPAEAPKDKPE